MSPLAKTLLLAATSAPIRRRSIKVALFVGTVLNAINQGPALWHHAEVSWIHVALNFMVPFCVSSYSAASSQVERADPP